MDVWVGGWMDKRMCACVCEGGGICRKIQNSAFVLAGPMYGGRARAIASAPVAVRSFQHATSAVQTFQRATACWGVPLTRLVQAGSMSPCDDCDFVAEGCKSAFQIRAACTITRGERYVLLRRASSAKRPSKIMRQP
eukprot:365903-Chlamydomonas_euryale.AAC.2